VREKQATSTQPIVVEAGSVPDNSEVIAAREARKAQARARQAEKAQQQDVPESAAVASETVDPRKAAVEAAIARAKARKAATSDTQAAPRR
jgi:electron transport complex protein RnfC